MRIVEVHVSHGNNIERYSTNSVHASKKKVVTGPGLEEATGISSNRTVDEHAHVILLYLFASALGVDEIPRLSRRHVYD